MMCRSLHRMLAAVGAAVFLASHASAFEIPAIRGANGQVEITIRSPLDYIPSSGFAPVRVKISNGLGRRGTWNIAVMANATYDRSRTTESHFQATVEARAEREFEFCVPVPTLTESSYYPSIDFSVSGPGVSERRNWSPGYRGGYSSGGQGPCIALCGRLSSHWQDLQKEVARTKFNCAGSSVDLAMAPEDYRGWLGFDAAWIFESEWSALSDPQRGAILAWARLGGRLTVLRESALALPSMPSSLALCGWGEVRSVPQKDFNVRMLAGDLPGLHSRTVSANRGYSSPWLMRGPVPPIDVPSVLITIFVIAFTIVAGPVNLLVAARRRRHMQLFWTTPLISLSFSIVLIAVIFLRDGVGGHGRRMSIAFLDPSSHSAAILQEQVSRTGVLLGQEFSSDAAFLGQLNVDDHFKKRGAALSATDGRFGGQWFCSRSVQAQALMGQVPSRERVAVIAQAGQPPVAVSQLEAPLEALYYIDSTGGVWTSQARLASGERSTLKPADTTFETWWNRVTLPGGYLLNHACSSVRHKGWFYAVAAPGANAPFDSLASIRWRDDIVFYCGPAAEAAP
jgi:hypothetical protein